jgi:hypothetical protein
MTKKFQSKTPCVATPLWGKCEVATHTPENGTWKSSGTPENSEFDCRGQNTSPWGVLYTVGKVLKCKCPKWPRISHLDFCSTSYGRKKGRESNWQFDSRPQKVENRPDLVRAGGVRHAVEKLSRRATSLIQTSSRSEVWARSYELPKSRESKPGQFRDSFGTPTWESQDKQPFGCSPRGVVESILYGGRWWLPPNPGRGESSESKLLVDYPNTKGVPECELTNLWLVLDAGPCNKIIIPLPSLIPEPQHAPLPLLLLRAGSMP